MLSSPIFLADTVGKDRCALGKLGCVMKGYELNFLEIFFYFME
ncbi:hypothetical protein EZJ58_3201 [Sodalis ligni]|uniref:Uncharacterized protein n=1 Tax=Sodalis ligni TaxID=2697027 RepID=A0A4R1NC11_9GAMM|nr:hypothetical protein EZJ58_3201 [Sodalis ligni]